MINSNYIYIIAGFVLFNILSFLLTNNSQEVVRKAIHVNVITASTVLIFGDYITFLFIFFLNIFIFITLSFSGFEASETNSFQEPWVDIPLLLLILVIFGVVVIGIFKNIDYLEIKDFFNFNLDWIKVVRDYQDLIAAFLIVLLVSVVTLNLKIEDESK